MSSKQELDLRAGFDQRHINSSNGIASMRENGESTTQTSCANTLALNDLSLGEDKWGKKTRIVGWGLRKFSGIVCAKVQARGRTTYNQVADEIVSESKEAPSDFPFDEKNIRRRVYDAINVLMAINYIKKDKKELRWIGCPVTSKSEELDELKEMRMNLINRIQAKVDFMKELEEKFVDLQNLMLRNQQAGKSGITPCENVTLPFLLVRTHPRATVEIEISEDMQLVHFDFNGTPFTLHDDAAVLKAKRCPKSEHIGRSSSDGASPITDQSGKPIEPASFSWNSEDLKRSVRSC